MKIHPQVVSWNESTEIPTHVKAVGALSLVLWFGVLSYGRLIPYIGTG